MKIHGFELFDKNFLTDLMWVAVTVGLSMVDRTLISALRFSAAICTQLGLHPSSVEACVSAGLRAGVQFYP